MTMYIFKVVSSAEYPTTTQNPDGSVTEKVTHILECFGFETEEAFYAWNPSQFTVHTEFPQAYKIMTHMAKPTLDPYILEMQDE